VRWPGRLEAALARGGTAVRVIEDCLNGRRTVWEDPFKPGRNGTVGLAQRIELNSPLALVVLLLGTNDFQSMHTNDAWHSGQGIAALVREIRCASPTAPLRPGLNGSSHTVRRPLRQSSITRTAVPPLASAASSRPGQRTVKGCRSRVPGTIPHESESP